jgi:hypothetical protein
MAELCNGAFKLGNIGPCPCSVGPLRLAVVRPFSLAAGRVHYTARETLRKLPWRRSSWPCLTIRLLSELGEVVKEVAEIATAVNSGQVRQC